MTDNKKDKPTQITSLLAAKAVSPVRRKLIGDQIEKGEFVEGRGDSTDKNARSIMSHAHVVPGLIKRADNSGLGTDSNTLGSSWRGSGGTGRQAPEMYSPLWLTSNTQLPRDRGTMNAWARAFFALNPIVNNALSLHSTYPISKLNVKCANKKVENFFEEMIYEMELHNACTQIAQEYFVIGECFPYLQLDERKLRWNKVIIQNPDYVFVKRTVVAGEPQISLRPDSELRRIITGTDADSAKLRRSIPPNIVQFVKAGKNIPLDNFFVSHLARKISPYDSRGTSLIAPCFKALMLWDKLRECKYAQADNMINPITLVKLGGSADSEYKITPADLEYWRQLLEEATYDKDFKIITHGSVSIEKISSNGVIDINPDLQQLMKEIYIGLMVPQVIMEAGDITYANGGLSLDVLRQRYMQFQNMLAKWIKTKIFQPIAELNDFWEYKDGEKKLIIPEVEWNHMSMFDLADYIGLISQLVTAEKKIVSVHSLFRSLGLDYEDEQRRTRHENIVEAIAAREKEALTHLTLTELRALDVDDEIPDIPESPVPGEKPKEPSGGEEEGGGGEGGVPPPPPPPGPPV
jgi:hypothetical protein